MDPIGGIRRRGACTDAERRACVHLHDDLRAHGHEAWVETYWVRPQWAGSLTVHALLGVLASLFATEYPWPAAGVAGFLAVSLALELFGPGLLRLTFFRRATQLVVVEAPDPEEITLVVVAGVDTSRRGLVFRPALLPLARIMRSAAAALLAAVAACAAARGLGAEGTVIGAVQLVPTIVLLLILAAAIDVALSDFAEDDGCNLDVALDLYDDLARRPPQRFSSALLLVGAHPLAMRAHLRRERPEPARTVLLEVGPCGSGETAWATTHPQLRAAAERTSAPRRGRAPRARVPVIRVAGGSHEQCLDVCLELVEALDEDLTQLAESEPTV